MQHVGIDLGGRESQICVRAEDGRILHEAKIATLGIEGYLKRQPPSRVVLETCAEAFGIADKVLSFKHEIRLVPTTLVRSLGVGAGRIKTDRRDAQVLSEVSCRIGFPSLHVPTEQARRRQNMCAAREELIAVRTALINSVRGWARTQLLKVRSGATQTMTRRVREAAIKHSEGMPQYIERLLLTIETLHQQIAEADKELKQLAAEDPICHD